MEAGWAAGVDEAMPYWDLAETMPRTRLEDVQEQRFLGQIRRCWDQSEWYREHWGQHDVHPDKITGLCDLALLPMVTKRHIRESQEKHGPYGMMLADTVESSSISRIGMTSGTTGKPVLLPFTAEDYRLWMRGVVRGLWASGVRSRDIVHAAFGFTPFLGLAGAYDACERWIGSTVIPGGAWDSATRIAMLPLFNVTVLMGTPTYLLRLGRLATESGVNLKDWSIRMLFVTGEPGPMSVPATGDRLQRLWHAPIREFCGSQETNYWAWTCSEGRVHWNEDLVYFEVLDPDTNRPVPPGQPGSLVVTDLCQRTHPLLRFPTGDRVAGFVTAGCPCGRTLQIFKGFLGRVDDVVKIRGVSVAPAGIENIVRSHPLASDSYQIEFHTDADGMDKVTISVEPTDGLPEDAWLRLQLDLASRLHAGLMVHMDVVVLAPGSLPIFELKAKRVVDRRVASRECRGQGNKS